MSVKVNRKGKKKKYYQLTWTNIELEEGSVYSTASITEETAFFAASLYLRIHNDLLKEQDLNIINNGSNFTLNIILSVQLPLERFQIKNIIRQNRGLRKEINQKRVNLKYLLLKFILEEVYLQSN